MGAHGHLDFRGGEETCSEWHHTTPYHVERNHAMPDRFAPRVQEQDDDHDARRATANRTTPLFDLPPPFMLKLALFLGFSALLSLPLAYLALPCSTRD
eukprot:5247418-Prymnesium_polylepis.1